MKTREKIFDECINEAIKMGRKYMFDKKITDIPTEEEWSLAMVLFSKRI